jgi:hypothetical protein
MNSISGLKSRIQNFKNQNNLEFTNQNFYNPSKQINSNTRIWISLATTNTSQPIPGWTITGTNSSVYVCNGVTAFCRFISNKVQYLFITMDKTPYFCSIMQNIYIPSIGVYQIKFYICARLTFGNPTVKCIFNGNTVTSLPSQDSSWLATTNISNITTVGVYPLEFSFPDSQVCIADVTVTKLS